MEDYNIKTMELFKYFSETVIKNFNFLEDLDYKHRKVKNGYIQYLSKTVDISIYYDAARSFEIDLTITLLKQNIRCYIDSIIRFCFDSDMKRQYNCAVNKETIRNAIEEIVMILKEYGMDFIDGNENAFKTIKKQIDEEHNKLVLEGKLDMIEKQAIYAWNNKDYLTVIKLYDTILEHLTSTQRKKLEICKK